MFLADHEIVAAIVAVIGSECENAIWGQISPKMFFMFPSTVLF